MSINKTYITVLIFVLNAFLLSICSSMLQISYFFDISNRLNINNSLIDLFHFTWTNVNYLYTLLPLLLSIFTILLYSYRWATRIILAHLFFLVTTSHILGHDLLLSHSSLVCSPALSSYNVLLINSLNKYHPMILYMCLLYLVLSSYNYKKSLRYLELSQLELHLVMVIITLYFGSWWAYQEGSWGGWWNWDPSEMFGLSIMTLLLYWRHSHVYAPSNSIKPKLFMSYALTLLVFYSFLQLNFDLISHNFGLRDQSLVDIRILYSLTILLLAFLIKRCLCSLSAYRVSNTSLSYGLVNTLAMFLVIALFGLSLVILFNDITWRITKINVLNINPDYKLAVLMLVFTFVFKYNARLNYINISITTLLTLASPTYFWLLPLLLSYGRSKFFRVHLLLLIIATCYTVSEYASSNWSVYCLNYLSYASDYIFGLRLEAPTYATTLANMPFLGDCFVSQSYLTCLVSNSNIVYNSTSPEFKTFAINSLTSNTSQSLISDNDNWAFSNSTSAYGLANVNLCVLVLIYMSILFRSESKKVCI